MRIRFFVVAITLALTLITVGLLFHAFYDAHVELLPSRSQIYVVSLATRTDRRSRMERLRLQMGLRWTYFDATDSSDSAVYATEDFVRAYRQRTMPESFQDSFRWPDDAIERSVNSLSILPSPQLTASHAIQIHSDPLTCALEDSKILRYRESMPEYKVLTHARIACWISHLEVIRRIANDFSVDYGVILEDDVDMEKDIGLQLLHLWQYLPQTWDILFLGYCWSDETANAPLSPAIDSAYFHQLHPSSAPKCSHAYILSRSGARRLFLHLTHAPFAYSRAIDQAFAWLSQSGRLKSYSVVPSIVVQMKDNKSSIRKGGKSSEWKDSLRYGVLGGPGSPES